MKKSLKIKAEGAITLSAEGNFFNSIRNINTWYTNNKFTIPVLLAAAGIDISGFYQAISSMSYEQAYVRIIIIAAFVIAFELAPLYVGYAMCLKAYDLGKRIRKKVFYFSLASFILGTLANTYFRLAMLEINKLSDDFNPSNTPFTVLMIILPLMTSLMNFAIGCLSFDPLLFDLKRLAKRLGNLKSSKRRCEAELEKYADDFQRQQEMLQTEREKFEHAKIELITLRVKLHDYINLKSISKNDLENKK